MSGQGAGCVETSMVGFSALREPLPALNPLADWIGIRVWPPYLQQIFAVIAAQNDRLASVALQSQVMHRENFRRLGLERG